MDSIRALGITAVGLTLVGMAAIGCGPRAPDRLAIPEPVSVGMGVEALAGLIPIAEAQGFFKDEGLAVRVRKYGSGKLALQAMLNGEVAIATVAQAPVVVESVKHPELRIVAVIGISDNDQKIVARTDPTLQKPKELRGRRVATQEGSSMHFFLHMFLLRHGLSEQDVTVSFAQPDQLPELLAKGEVEAIATREPLVSRAAKRVGSPAVVWEEPGFYVKYYLLVTTQRLLAEQPAVVRRVLQALIRSEQWARTHPDEAQAIVSRTLDLDVPTIARLWPDLDYRVWLPQSVLVNMEDEARWLLGKDATAPAPSPNYLPLIDVSALEGLKPEAVTIIR